MWSDGQRGRKIIKYKESERNRETETYSEAKKEQDEERNVTQIERDKERDTTRYHFLYIMFYFFPYLPFLLPTSLYLTIQHNDNLYDIEHNDTQARKVLSAILF